MRYTLFWTLQYIPEIVKVGECLLFLLPNLLDNPDKAVRDAFFTPINADNVGVQIFSPPFWIENLYHGLGNRLVTYSNYF